jgi:hypothetical protein
MGALRRIVAALIAAGLGSGCALLIAGEANPGDASSDLQILSPVNHSQSTDGHIDVDIRIGATVDKNSLHITLVTGTDFGGAPDITDHFTIAGDHATAQLAPPEIQPGLTMIAATANTTAGEARAQSAVSWEPGIDVSAADHCEFLGQSRCLLPFPSDWFTVSDSSTDTGRRVNLSSAALPTNVSGTPMDPSGWNSNDGFSPGSAIVVHVPSVDLAASGAAPVTDIGRSLAPDAPIVLLDTQTGRRWPYFAEVDAWASTPETAALVVRPARNFLEGHHIVVALRNLVGSNGATIPASRAFSVYRDRIPTYLPVVEGRRPQMESDFAALERAGIARNDLYLAWDFTIASERNLSERVLTMRDDALGSLHGGAPAFQVTSVDNNVSASIARRVTGTFTVPSYLTGDGGPGSRLDLGPDGLPVRTGSIAANFICIIPASVAGGATSAPQPGAALVYGHGLLGSAGEVNGFGDLANAHGIVMCGTDWIGMSSADIPNVIAILGDLSKFPSLPDRCQQAFVNFQFLARLMKSNQGFVTDPAFQAADSTPLIKTGSVFFNGNSQGGVMGGAATAISTEWTRAALGVPGMNYSTLLTRSVDWLPFSDALFKSYPDELDHTIGYSLIQMLWDRAETDGYAQHLTSNPLPNTPAHQVLLLEAFGDHQVANITTETEARTVGIPVWTPTEQPGRSTDVTPMWGISTLTDAQLPWAGSALVLWDYGTPAPPTQNLPPAGSQYGTDPHGLGRGEPRLGDQVADFALGLFVDHCSAGPCISTAH